MFKRNQVLIAIGVLVLLILVGVGAFMTGRNAGLTEQTNIRNEFFQQRSSNQGGAPGTQGASGSDTTQAARNLQGRQVATGVVKSCKAMWCRSLNAMVRRHRSPSMITLV